MTSQTPEEIPNIEETEALSEKIHHLYCAQYEKDHGEPYWTNGDYSKLDERTKEYDRNIARFINHQLQKAREEEKERCIKVVEDYGKSMSKHHNQMIGTAHEDSKMMLAFDAHSRLIAVKHITEKMNHSELDQDNK